MPIFRDRPKITYAGAVKVNLILTAGVVQVGDVRTVSPFSRTYSQGGPRGAASFTTLARHIHTATRLHFTDREDDQPIDDSILLGNIIQP